MSASEERSLMEGMPENNFQCINPNVAIRIRNCPQWDTLPRLPKNAATQSHRIVKLCRIQCKPSSPSRVWVKNACDRNAVAHELQPTKAHIKFVWHSAWCKQARAPEVSCLLEQLLASDPHLWEQWTTRNPTTSSSGASRNPIISSSGSTSTMNPTISSSVTGQNAPQQYGEWS